MSLDLKPRRRLLVAAGLLACATLAHAQAAYPNGPIRFIVPYPPGGPTDLMARMLQPELQSRLGVPVVIENKGGAGGNVGTAEVARQLPADGQTILLASSGPMSVNQTLFKNMPFNALTDLAPVVQISSFPLVLEVHPTLGAKSLAELIAMTKTNPTALSYASAGNGTPQHLAGELFSKTVGTKLSHVPYRGAGPALNDLLGGQVKVMFDVMASSLQHIRAGKLVPLAVTSSARSAALPEVPTMAEAGMPGFEMTAWHGIAVRAGTPRPVVERLNGAFNAIFADAAFAKKWEALGTPVVGGPPEVFGRLVQAESVRLGRLVQEAGVTAE